MKSYQKTKPIRSPKYRTFIRSQPCIICGTRLNVRHHHESLTGGTMGGKCCDKESLPICDDHHTISDKSVHRMGKKSFYEYWDIDYKEEILKLQRRFEDE